MFFAVGIFYQALRYRPPRRCRPVPRDHPAGHKRPSPPITSPPSPSLPSPSPPIPSPPSTVPPIPGIPSTSSPPSRPPQLAAPPTKPSTADRCTIRPGRTLDCTAFEAFCSVWSDKPPGYFRVQSRLGGGAFAQVFKATDDHGREVALKALDRVGHESDLFLHTLLQREISNQKQLTHPNIAQVYGKLQTSKYILVVQELCSGGNLFRFSCQRRTEEQIKEIVRGMLLGLQHCHDKNIVHCDIKPENVLLTSDGRDGVQVKLVDFGQSLWLDPARQWRGGGGLEGDEGEDCEIGTAAYAPPEMYDCRLCDVKVDMWALGVLVYELFFEVVPFEDAGRPYADEVRFPMPAVEMSSDAKSLIKALLTEDVHARLSSAQALEHRWFCC